MSEYLTMGGYAGYVWPTYAVAVGVLVVLWWSTVRAFRRSRATLESLKALRRRGGDDAAGEACTDSVLSSAAGDSAP